MTFRKTKKSTYLLFGKFSFIILLFFFWGIRPAHAEGLPQYLSYEQYQTLVRQKVYEIPELTSFWEQARSKSNIRQTYLGGGVLRGLLHWIHGEIAAGRLEALKSTRPPKIQKLLLQEWSDQDMVVPNGHEGSTLSQLIHIDGYWDMLPESFMLDSTRAGGTTLEKVCINPWDTRDPLNGLRDCYDGKLVFAPGSVNVGAVQGNTELAQALRFIRLSRNLPELVPTKESAAHIKGIGSREFNTIVPGLQGVDWWITKGVRKLYHATGRNIGTTLGLLHEYNLLSLLAQHGYHLPETESINLTQLYQYLEQNRGTLSLEDKIGMAKVAARNISERQQLLSWVQNGAQNDQQRQLVNEEKQHVETGWAYFKLNEKEKARFEREFHFRFDRALDVAERMRVFPNWGIIADKVIRAGDLEYLFAMLENPDYADTLVENLGHHPPTPKLIGFFRHLLTTSSPERLNDAAKKVMIQPLWNQNADVREVFANELMQKAETNSDLLLEMRKLFAEPNKKELNRVYDTILEAYLISDRLPHGNNITLLDWNHCPELFARMLQQLPSSDEEALVALAQKYGSKWATLDKSLFPLFFGRIIESAVPQVMEAVILHTNARTWKRFPQLTRSFVATAAKLPEGEWRRRLRNEMKKNAQLKQCILAFNRLGKN